MEPMIKRILLPVGFTGLLLAACGASPDVHFRPETPESSTGTVHTPDFTNEAMPKNIDSLEVATESGAAHLIKVLSGAILIGKDSAPKLTIYTDYSCEYCRQFAIERQADIEREFVDTGKIAIQFVFIPRDAAGILMAKTALCGAEKNVYRAVERELLARPLESENDLPALAKKTGLNLTDLKTCIHKKSLETEIQSNADDAKAAGITRVPTFSLGNELWIGVMEKTELIEKIEKAMK